MRLGYNISLSERIKELLDEGTLNQIMDQVVEDVKEELIQTAPHDTTTREQLYNEVHALQRVRIRLAAIVQDILFAEGRD